MPHYGIVDLEGTDY